MEQWNFRDGIIPFLIAVAMYGFYLSQSFWQNLGQSWKEAKRKLASWRDYEVRVEAPDEASRVLLQQKTFNPDFNTLGSLGFECLGDFVVRAGVQTHQVSSSAPLASPNIDNSKQFLLLNLVASRVYIHKGHGCIAFVSVASARGVHPLIQIASQGEGWTYTSEASDAISGNAGRAPRDLKSHHGSASPKQLLEAHLENRTQIAQAGGFQWGAPPTMQEIFIEEEKHAAYVREFARHHSTLSLLIWHYKQKRQGQGDWLGELASKVSLPKASAS